jgi:hypothetical protein
LFLVGALLPIVLSGLLLARAAQAATTAPAAPAAHSAVAATSATAGPARPASTATTTAMTVPSVDPCHIPGIGDLGSLAGLCSSGSGAIGQINNICSPGTEQPESASAGLNSLIAVPGGVPTSSSLAGGKGTLYDQYGVAGQNWSAYGLQCSDMTSLIGNDVSNMVFNFAKSLDRLTITVYQSAASDGILTWLSGSVNNLITALGNAIYFPYLAPIVILGAIWLAWQGLIRKRATRTIEGTIWMVIACAAAIWLIGRPGDFTSIGTTVSNGVTNVMDVAFGKLPAPVNADCLPVGTNDPQSVPPSYAFTSGNGVVDQNANELWSVLVCKPWLNGEFGTTVYSTKAGQPATIVNQYGRELLWSQAIGVNETPTTQLITQKQDVYQGIAAAVKANYPADYSLFQGNQWTTRLEIGFSSLFAAVAAGLLVLLIALTLILLKLGFLLLLVAGPFFLIVGTHPGFGRVIAIRWFEMIIGVLLKQIAVALTLSVLLYCYSLIMGTSDTALPWVLKIIMITLVTVAVFIYRRPFQHLFSSVGYGLVGAETRADVSLREGTFGFRRATAGAAGAAAGVAGGAAGAVVPGVGAGLGARWARRFGDSAAAGADAGTDSAATGGMAGAAATAGGVRASTSGDGGTSRLRPEKPSGGEGAGSGGSGTGSGSSSGGRGRAWPDTGYGTSGRAAPPLPPRSGGGGSGAGGSSSGAGSAGWARSSGTRASTGPLPRASAGSSSPTRHGSSASSARSASGSTTRPAAPPPVPPPGPSTWPRPFRRGK